MNDRPTYLVNLSYLLTYLDTKHALVGSIWDDASISCDEDGILTKKFVPFKGYVAKNLLRNFLRVILAVLGGSNIWFLFVFSCCSRYSCFFCIESIWILFLYCNIRTQTGYYKKGICFLVADFLRCNTTRCYYNREITK